MSSRQRDISGLTGSQRTDPSTLKGNNYLFVVAIDEYENLPKLHNCVKDANELIQQLVYKYNFKEQHVFKLFNQKASIDNIYNQMLKLSRMISSNDNLMIFFAGHGFYDKDNKTGHLIPVNAEEKKVWDYLSNSNFLDWIRAIQSMHTLVILDSCFSGSMFSTRTIGTSYSENVATYKSRWGLAAGRIETVDDGLHGENSPFAKAIVNFLKKNTSTKFPVSDLIQYVKKVTANNSAQTPIAGPIKNLGDEGGEFIFELSTNVGTEWEKAKAANSLESYSTFIANYPESEFKAEAEKRLQPLQEAAVWSDIQHMPHKALTDVVEKQRMITDYKFQYPKGKHRIKADQLLTHLNETEELLKKKKVHQANQIEIAPEISGNQTSIADQEIRKNDVIEQLNKNKGKSDKLIAHLPAPSRTISNTTSKKASWLISNKIVAATMVPIIAIASFFLVNSVNKHKGNRSGMDQMVFNSLQDSEDVKVFSDFVAKFPRSQYISEVQEMKNELEYWQKIVEQKSVEGYESYLIVFEEGRFSERAKASIKNLGPSKTTNQSEAAISQNTTKIPSSTSSTVPNKEAELWKRAQSENTKEAYKEYLRAYPNSTYSAIARRAIKKGKRDGHGKGKNKGASKMSKVWEQTLNDNSSKSYREFLNKYPNSPYKKEAQEKLSELGGSNLIQHN